MGEDVLLSSGAGTVQAAARAAAGAAAQAVADVPLVVDLDGTLIRTDSLLESLFVLARSAPFCCSGCRSGCGRAGRS
jgi:hypothetical protein